MNPSNSPSIIHRVESSRDEFNNPCLYVREDAGFRNYSVTLVTDLLQPTNNVLSRYIRNSCNLDSNRVFVIASPSVWKRFGNEITSSLLFHGVKHQVLHLKPRARSEDHKSLDGLAELATQLQTHSPQGGDLLLVMGGGGLTDVAGFLAATWRRGQLQYISLPTTLLAAADAALSPKTAVNVGNHKNILGNYYPPSSVLVWPGFLETVNRQSLVDGMAEIVKIAVVADRELFAVVETSGQRMIAEHFQSHEGHQLLWRASELFLRLKWDPKFPRTRNSIRSFGHAFSREAEGRSAYSLSHGEAVSIEMRIAIYLAMLKGILNDLEGKRIMECFDRLGLATWADCLEPNEVWDSVFRRLYETDQEFGFVTVRGIGEGTYLNRFTLDELSEAMVRCKKSANGRVLRVAP